MRIVLAAAALVVAFQARPAEAGRSLFQPAWTPAARADLVRLVEMEGWPPRSAEFAVDAFVARLERHADDSDNVFLPASHLQGVDSVAVGGHVRGEDRKRPGCFTAAAVLSNPLRNRTTIAGMFCSRSQSSWTYDPVFLEVDEFNGGGVSIRTLDVTDIGKVRPPLR